MAQEAAATVAAAEKAVKAKVELANTSELLTEAHDEADNDSRGFADCSVDVLEKLTDAAQSRVVRAKMNAK